MRAAGAFTALAYIDDQLALAALQALDGDQVLDLHQHRKMGSRKSMAWCCRVPRLMAWMHGGRDNENVL